MSIVQIHSSLGQIDPSDGAAIYSFSEPSSTTLLLAKVIACGANGPFGSGLMKGHEYWQIYPNTLKTCGHLSLCVTADKMNAAEWANCKSVPFNCKQASFVVSSAVEWKIGPGDAQFHKPATLADAGGFVIDVSCTNDQWRGSMQFYRSSERLLFQSMSSGSNRQYSNGLHSFSECCIVDLKNQIACMAAGPAT